MDKSLKRGAGILLPISSLPSNYGIGTLGDSAYDFINQLATAKMSYWQVLPIGPTSYGDSPYQSLSTFAGNPYFIDLDFLYVEKLLSKDSLENIQWSEQDDRVSYGLLWEHRFDILKTAFKTFKISARYNNFVKKNSQWLEDYALFMACKSHFNNQPWYLWEQDIKFRQPKAIKTYSEKLQEEIDFYKFIQFKFYEQWTSLKEFAHDKGVSIIGDIPIYVSLDSADVWANPDLFLLDENLTPKVVAGCPPDGFSADGQKWGNPLYDWDAMEKDDFSWWKNRMEFAANIYDIVRIDHFIGIERYYSIPLDKPAKEGWYTDGPSRKLIDIIDQSVGQSKIIAEDLGVLTDEVKELLKYSGYPGMSVLEFAFGSDNANLYLPHNHKKNSVLYLGTHDNDTFVGYLKSSSCNQYMMDYLDCKTEDELFERIIRFGYASVADVFILQMQDILGKDETARMNFPSTDQGNWQWRMKKDEFNHMQKLLKLNEIYQR